MKTVRTVAELRSQLARARRAGHTIGLVPTMGAFHAGHLSLMRRARDACDVVVVSLFVNPAQFNEATDLDVYPRDEARDAELAVEQGVDFLFAPGVDEVYPDGFATSVAVRGLTDGLEGAHRGHGHFDGVTTVVSKLLNMVGPDVAYFGQKDAQQATVVRRLVRDLNFPVRIEVCPTVRGEDGLALSSRNVLLTAAERVQATALYRALRAVQAAVAAGERDPEAARAAGLSELAEAGIDPEYLAVVAADTMEPVASVEGDVLVAVAAQVGAVRLIDNVPITVLRSTLSSTDTEVATPHGAPTT
ncbi:MAG TPA: pantoate--beta-alanine ligase [Solirubrobacteraceae bacterium]|nr:pantoate--beta-alanine ligase [Solirubrobacteraceae bacterium]